MNLTTLGAESTEQIIAFDRLCFPTDCWKEDDWKELLQDERAIYFAFTDRGKIVGDVFVYNWKGEKEYIKIMNLAVHPAYRRQGLARRLLNYVTDEAAKLEMKQLRGETRASNTEMQHVFEACGYHLSTVEEGYYDSPVESAYKYVLQL